jgi:hypothetical protein
MTPAKPKTPEENITQSTGVAPENAETPTARSRSFTCAAAQERRSATDYRSEWNRRTGAVRQASMVGWAFHPSETARANTENGWNRIESGSSTGTLAGFLSPRTAPLSLPVACYTLIAQHDE